MEVEQAKNKLEETLRQTDASMDAILCSDIDRVAQLKHLIDAQAEFHTKAGQLLNELSSTLNKRIQEAKPRSGSKPMASLKAPSGGAWGGDSDIGFPTSFSSNFDNNKIVKPIGLRGEEAVSFLKIKRFEVSVIFLRKPYS